MMRTVALVIFMTLASACLQAADLNSLIKDTELFSHPKSQVLGKYGDALGFRWVSAEKKAIRSESQKLSLFGLQVLEAIVHFDGEKVESVYLSIYNRGDAEDLNLDEFEGIVQLMTQSLSKLLGTKPEVRNSSTTIQKRRCRWTKSGRVFTLEYSGGKTRDATGKKVYRAEYVRLIIDKEVKPKGRAPVRKARTSGITSRNISELKDSIVKAKNGDVYLDGVPMVDQGQKGYCACATVARVLGYFGRKIDQHEIAQIANSDRLGTSPSALLKALKDVRTRLRISVKEEMVFDERDFNRSVKEYNRLAKKCGLSERKLESGMDLKEFFNDLNTEVWVKARTKRSSDLRKFLQSRVKRTVDYGLPLVWSVMLGIVKERGLPQASGGHMRLILGYNLKTEEIIYSDSWGRGHERKRMKARDALAITTGLYVIRPR